MTPIERLAQLFAGIPDPTEEISRKQHGRVAAEINIDHELQVLALSDQDDSAAADAADAADAAKTAALPDHQSALRTLRGFMCKCQWSVLRDHCRPAVEEHEFFIRKAIELAGIIDAMPETKQTEGQGKAAIAHLHYFAGGQANFYITEKDCGSDDDTPEEFQSQAYGLADLFRDGGEIGYISLPEIFQSNAELDFYWTPKSLAEIRNET